jgi:DNA-binding GntR family transcriptional regulator
MDAATISMTVDRGSPIPLYFQLAQRLEHAIESGDLAPGTRLDNEIELAARLGVSRPTMRRAIQYLVDGGLLIRKRGVGTQVIATRVRRPVELTSLYDHLASTGRQPRTNVLSFTVEPASDAVAYTLGIAEGAGVYSFERLRYAEDKPLAVLRDLIPASLVELTPEALEKRGLYEILRENGIVPRIASQTIGARTASAAEARTLQEARGAPLLTMTRTAYDDHGHVIEHGNHVYRASLYSFDLVLTTS